MAVKHVKVAHPSRCQEVPENDIPRLLAQGWCELKPASNKKALEQRKVRARYKAAGLDFVAFYLASADHAALKAARLPGESMGELVVRLLNKYVNDSESETYN